LVKQQAIFEANRVLEEFSLKEAAHEKPLVLSHGMAKRVAIAQALIGKPELIYWMSPPPDSILLMFERCAQALLNNRQRPPLSSAPMIWLNLIGYAGKFYCWKTVSCRQRKLA
jgi:ABC-type taurine transport system ATPase subunit